MNKFNFVFMFILKEDANKQGEILFRGPIGDGVPAALVPSDLSTVKDTPKDINASKSSNSN